jgi:hypothetical protein
MTTKLWTAVAVTLLLAGTALAGTPAQDCESRKNKEAGKYLKCRHKAEARLALGGAPQAGAIALQKCADKYAENWLKIEGKARGACPSTGDLTAVRQYLDTASTDVANALSGEPLTGDGHRVKTGQTLCWSGFSTSPIPCAGTGKDGELQAGLDRLYVDNGDGTMTDVRTGLMWEKLSDDGSIHDQENNYTSAEASAYKIAGLNAIAFAGYTDWRLPNVNEVQSMLHYGVTYPAIAPAFQTGCVPGCTVLTCSCAWKIGYTHGIFWTSTTLQQAPFYVWTVGVYDGHISYTARTERRHVRAVRGGA